MIKKWIFIFLFPCFLLHSAKIGVAGWRKGYPYVSDFLRKELEPFGHSVELVWEGDDFEEYAIIVACNYKHFLKGCKEKVIISLFEPEVILKESGDLKKLRGHLCALTWNHDLSHEKGFDSFFYPCSRVAHKDDSLIPPFDKRKFACMISSYLPYSHPKELYSVRRNVVKFYKRNYPKLFSLYGKRGWGGLYHPVFKGLAEDKDAVLKAHRFNYCFENWDNDVHYISEKIIDSFNNLSIPIYLGSSRIAEYIPEDTFIDARKFKSILALHHFLETMDEVTYQGYIDAIIEFSKSSMIEKFTHNYHNHLILKKIKENL